ncbi:uncharacterized protein LOC106175244 [Lingula anatina]|uniref:Uncharacterized protein LOC106175244 n=1 Tax=Lingula anatina TaxID=7574 RepID=A0A1S3JQH4_LINAN|nr:uncharacterized protein LOC106175244 [Lingula anatina]|eukprot:XP_013412607.1 uncharacterized protein LOC106175244 [Lingula anatina]
MSLVTSAGAETRAAEGVRVWTDQQHSVTVQGQTQKVGGRNDQRTLGCCLEVKKYGMVMQVVGITCSHWSIGQRCFIRHQERDIDIGVVTGRCAEWTVISLTDSFLDILDAGLWFGNVTEALAGGWGGVRRKLPVGSIVNVMKQDNVVTAKVTQHHDRFFNVSCASTAHFTEHDCGSIVAVNSVLCGVVVHAPSDQEAEVAHFTAVLSKVKSDLWSHSDFTVELATGATRLNAEIKPVLEVDMAELDMAELVNHADCCQERSAQLPADSTSYQPPPVSSSDETAEKCFKQLLLKGTRKEKQIRLMVVGPPKVGKTHIIRQLFGQQYDPEGDKNTNGVVVNFGACVINEESAVTWKAKSEEEHAVTQARLVAKKMISVEAKEKVATEWEEILICPKCPTVVEPGLKVCENCSTPIARKMPEVADESSIQVDREDCNKLEDGIADDDVYAVVYEQYKSKINSKPCSNWMLSNWFSLREGGSSHVSGTEKDTIRLSVWDLGGQHVNCSINQIILTGRAIYLLVVDLTKGLDQPMNIEETGMCGKDRAVVGVPRTLGGFLEFWMRSIHQNSVGKGSLPEEAKDNDRLCPSIIIVGTHKDKVTQSTKDERLNEIRKYLETKPHYDQIHGVFFAVDNTDMDDPALQDIRQAIEEIAKQQTYWGKKRPIRWVLLEEKLRTISKECPYVHFSEAESHAKKYNISKDELYICLSYFHEIGVFPFYDHGKLGAIVILDPQWLFNAIKTVLTLPHCEYIKRHSQTKSYLKEKAILREKFVNLAWKNDDRLLENKNLLLKLMQRYDLAYLYTPRNLDLAPPCALGERLFLIPSLLKVAEPKDFILADNAVIKPIYIQSKYDFIPQGLFLRLLVGMHKKMFLQSNLLFGDYACFRIQAPNSNSATGRASAHVLEMKYDEYRIKLKVGTLSPGEKLYTPCKSALYARNIVVQKFEGLRRKHYPHLEWDFVIELNSSGESVFVPIDEDNVLQQGYLIYQGQRQTVNTSLYSIWFQREDEKCQVFPKKEEKEQESKNQATLKAAPVKGSSTPYTCIGLEECEEVEVPPCKEDVLTFDSLTVYDCLTENRGRAVIINNVNFYTDDNPKYEDRYGTEIDVQRLTKLFEKLHYLVTTYTNRPAWKINKIALDEGQYDHGKYSSFIMVILSHGSKNTVIGSDGAHITYDQIRQPFTTTNCPSLKGKPKMFFISACQSDQSASGSPEDEAQGSSQSTRLNAPSVSGASGDPPDDADMILATATTPGKVSWRSTETGTRFVKSLVKVFSAKACEEDLASMLTQVNNEVASMTSGGRSQVSNIQLNTLRKKLFFCPGYYMQDGELKQYK